MDPHPYIPLGLPGSTTTPPPWAVNLTGLALDRGPLIIGIVSVLWGLTIIAISLRVLSKYIAKTKWWWDDYLAIIAWMFYSVKAISTIYSSSPTVNGGAHYWMVTFQQGVEFLKMQSLQFTMYPLGMGAAKCSIIAFYIKIFGVQARFRKWCYCLLGLVLCWSISLTLVTIFMCLPAGSAWDITVPGRTCINQQAFFNISAILDAILNFLILVSPLYSTWQLKLTRKKKIAVSAVLMLGAGEFIFTIIRIVIWVGLDVEQVPWDFYPIFIWTNVQESIGVVCICLPALGPLLKYRSKKATEQYRQSESSNPVKAAPMGVVTLCESSLGHRHEDEIPMKGVTKKSTTISSYSNYGDGDSV